MTKRKGFANVHTHHFIGNYVPDTMFVQQSGFKEKLIRKLNKFHLPKLILRIFYPQLYHLIRLLDSDDINEVRKLSLKDMEASSIDYSVVLLADYSLAAPKMNEKEKLAHYRVILKETAESIVKNPFKFFLYHYFDPRFMVMADNIIGVKDYTINDITYKNTTFSIRLLLNAYYHHGAVGIKLYPPLGYHPIPEANLDKENLIQILDKELNEKEREYVKHNLEFLYEFAGEKGLPLLSHCGPGGSYNVVISDELKGRHVWSYTNPMNFEEIMNKYGNSNLRFCFAHMGGKPHKLEESDMARIWRKNILSLIKKYPGHFYADVSYELSNFLAIKEKKWDHDSLDACIREMKEYLEDKDSGDYILFGSDWPLNYPMFNEWDYVKVHREGLGDELFQKMASDNISRFLFGEDRIIPDNHMEFLLTHHGDTLTEPDWVIKETTPEGKDIYKLV